MRHCNPSFRLILDQHSVWWLLIASCSLANIPCANGFNHADPKFQDYVNPLSSSWRWNGSQVVEMTKEYTYPSWHHESDDDEEERLEGAPSYNKILKFPPRNYTRTAMITYSKKNETDNSIPQAPVRKGYAKPKLILTLSVRSPLNPAPDCGNNTDCTSSSTTPPSWEKTSTTELIAQELQSTLNETLGSLDKKMFNILDKMKNFTKYTKYRVKKMGAAVPIASTEAPMKVEASTNFATNINPYDFIPSSSASPFGFSSIPPSPFTTNDPHSTTPIVLKVGTLSSNNDGSTTKDDINIGETRFAITADQLSHGNRPTSVPFHFTTAPPTPPPPRKRSTVSPLLRGQIQKYDKAKSPHNLMFSPTRDPTEDVTHDEDITVEDFRDIRFANLVFGSKMGADVNGNVNGFTLPPLPVRSLVKDTPSKKEHSRLVPKSTPFHNVPTLPSTTKRYKPPVEEYEDDNNEEENEIVANPLEQRQKNQPSFRIVTTPKTTTTTTRRPTTTSARPPAFVVPAHRQFVSSNEFTVREKDPGHVVVLSSSPGSGTSLFNNDNLPFYKEAGGIFKEHRYTTDLDDDNDVDQDPEGDSPQVARNKGGQKQVAFVPQLPQGVQLIPTNNPVLYHYAPQLPSSQPILYQQQQQQQGHQLPQNNGYFQPVVPQQQHQQLYQQQVYTNQGLPTFVPIQQIQQQQQHNGFARRSDAAISDNPVGPVSYVPSEPITPKPYDMDDFPSPEDPQSDTFYGDPVLEAEKRERARNLKKKKVTDVPKGPSPSASSRSQHDDIPQHRRPAVQPRRRRPDHEIYEEEILEPPRRRNNKSRAQKHEEPDENEEEYRRRNNKQTTAPQADPGGDFYSQSFRPSQVDWGPIRPSDPDYNPNFDDREGRQTSPTEADYGIDEEDYVNHKTNDDNFDTYDNGGQRRRQPMYKLRMPERNNDRKRPQTRPRSRPQKYEEEEEETVEDEEQIKKDEEEARKKNLERYQKRIQAIQRQKQLEELEAQEQAEEEEEEAPRKQATTEKPARVVKSKKQVEEEEEEEEEESETQQTSKKQPKENLARKEKQEEAVEEEEEEEEEEQKRVPLGNRQRNSGGKQEGKQVAKSKKAPANEKSGDLDEDIRGIEREFGGPMSYG